MKRVALLVVVLCGVVALSLPVSTPKLVQAQMQQPAENKGAAAAWQALLRLRSTATVLHTTAHPDDEDGAMLAWLSRHEGIRTGLLTLNRGEGGANLIGPELYDAMGVLRTEELLAAGRYYGVDHMFTRVTDFGFSKRLDETIEHWGKDVVLNDVVHAVRLYRPDIILSRFHGKPRDGQRRSPCVGSRKRLPRHAGRDGPCSRRAAGAGGLEVGAGSSLLVEAHDGREPVPEPVGTQREAQRPARAPGPGVEAVVPRFRQPAAWS